MIHAGDLRPRRILVVALLPIGDTLFATPALRALRQRFPGAHVTAVVYPSNRCILDGNPDVDELLVTPTRQHPHPALARDLWNGLRREPFDLGIGLNPFLAPAFRLLVGTDRWLDLPLPPWWWLAPQRQASGDAVHAVTHYLRTLAPLGVASVTGVPKVYLTAADRRWARDTLAARDVHEGGLLLAMHPGGEGWGGMKRWSPAHFAGVGRELRRRYGGTVLVLAGKDEVELAASVAARLGSPTLNLAGATTLKQTAALLERADLFVGNDSSPLHLAAAVGTPAVGIYGPSNPSQFAPQGANAVVVRSGRSCSPCLHFIGTQPLWKRPLTSAAPCLGELTPEHVVAAALRLLSRTGARHPAAQGGFTAEIAEGAEIEDDSSRDREGAVPDLATGSQCW